MDKVYGFPCIFFESDKDLKWGTFTQKGFNNCAHAIGDVQKGLVGHAATDSHINAVSKWENFKLNPVTIEERLNHCQTALVYQNQDYFCKIVKFI